MRFLIIFITLIFIQCSAFAENTQTQKLNMNEAMKLAVESNFELAQNKKDIDIAKNNISVANRLQNPQFETLFMLGSTAIGNPQAVGLALPIEIMKRGPRKNKAISEKSVVDSSVELFQFQLKMKVREAYIQLAAAKSVLKIVERQQETMAKMVDIAKKRYAVGVAPEAEVLQAEILYKQLETTYNLAKTQVETSKYDFNKVLNVDIGSDYDIEEDELPENGGFLKLSTPPPDKDIPSFEEIQKIAFANRYDVVIAEKEIQVAKNNLKVVARQRVPDIVVQSGYNFMSPYQNDVDRGGSGGYLSGAYVGGNIDLPVLYRFTPEIKNAKLEVEKKELALISVKNNVTQDLKKEYAEFELARKNLNYYTEGLLPKSQTTLSTSERGYEVGKSNLSTLILMGQSHLGVMMNYITALSNYYIEWVQMLTVLNVEDVNSAKID